MAGLGGSQGGHADVIENINTGKVFAFKLDSAQRPALIEKRLTIVQVDPSALNADTVSKGSDLYAVNCLRCHGFKAKASGRADMGAVGATVKERLNAL